MVKLLWGGSSKYKIVRGIRFLIENVTGLPSGVGETSEPVILFLLSNQSGKLDH